MERNNPEPETHAEKTRADVRRLIIHARTEDEARAAVDAGWSWVEFHPEGVVMSYEMSSVVRLLKSFPTT